MDAVGVAAPKLVPPAPKADLTLEPKPPPGELENGELVAGTLAKALAPETAENDPNPDGDDLAAVSPAPNAEKPPKDGVVGAAAVAGFAGFEVAAAGAAPNAD